MKKAVVEKRGVEKSSPPKLQRGKDSVPAIVGPLPDPEWKALRKKLIAAATRSPAQTVFPADTLGAKPKSGAIYLYGLAIARGVDLGTGPLAWHSVQAWHSVLAKLSMMTDCQKIPAHDRSLLCDEASQWLANSSANRGSSQSGEPSNAIEAILWATNMAVLTEVLPQQTWWQLLAQLQQMRADSALEDDSTTASYLMLAGELGITLAWRLKGLPSCQRIGQSSLDAVAAFIDREGDSIDEVLKQPQALRAVVASLVRCERILPAISKRKFKKRQREIAGEFATWIAALMRSDGTQVFSGVAACDVRPDVRSGIKGKAAKTNKKKTKTKQQSNSSVELLSGLAKAASQFDADTIVPAMAASLGQSHSGGRLAWEVCLPEAMWHSDLGKVVAMLPEWDVRRGRSFLNYSGEDIQVEIAGGRSIVFQGHHQTMVSVDGATMEPKGPWEYTCEYSDDDVHMIEFEQPHSGGVVLQRQWMVVREDRCVMVSDAVIPDRNATTTTTGSTTDSPEISCVSRLPLADEIEVTEDAETRELVLTDGKKKRCMVLPLAANEWRVGPSDCQVSVSEDRHLVVTTRGREAVYSPIWLDFQTRRFRRPRTWRPLTIAEGLSMVPRSIAAGFRIQFGSEHWVLYRSLSHVDASTDSQSAPQAPLIRTPRSFLGKHLIADFFAARFHPGDGGMEELVTVDDASGDASGDANASDNVATNKD